ncbi:MAG: phosphatidate cytidylyltransferase [Candidatus Eisenbacteria bacterium]
MPFANTRNGSGASAGSRPGREGGRGAGALRYRLLSAALFLPPFVLITRTGSVPFALLIGAVALLATWEIYRLLGSRGIGHLLPLGLVSSGILIALLYLGRLDRVFLFVSVFFAIALLSLILRKGISPFANAAGASFVLLYASVLPGFIVLLRELPRTAGDGSGYAGGSGFVFLLFLSVWGCDTGAYTVGRLAGRHLLAPAISPKKTVEGAVGGLLFAVAGAFAARAWLVEGLRPGDAVLIGLLAGALAQAGDLVESLLKREAAVKDSGPLIPGHGGVLDRFDSVFLAAPFVYFYLRAALFEGM